MTTEHWDDLDVTLVVHELGQYYVKWSLHSIVARSEDASGAFTVREYERKGATNSMDCVQDTSEAQTLIAGSIKWDGCSHFDFAPYDGGYIHICGADDAARLTKAIARLFEYAAAHVTGFDRQVAGMPLTDSDPQSQHQRPKTEPE
jgi:hypothetical protein